MFSGLEGRQWQKGRSSSSDHRRLLLRSLHPSSHFCLLTSPSLSLLFLSSLLCPNLTVHRGGRFTARVFSLFRPFILKPICTYSPSLFPSRVYSCSLAHLNACISHCPLCYSLLPALATGRPLLFSCCTLLGAPMADALIGPFFLFPFHSRLKGSFKVL